MNRTTVAAIATLIALVFLVGSSPALGMAGVWAGPSTGSGHGFAAAPNLQQSEALDISIWLSEVESTDPVRRLAPETSAAQIVIQSNLRDTDPNRFRTEVWDANGIRVYQSGTLQLPTGPHSESILITGGAIFRGYANYAQSEKTALQTAVSDAVSEANRTEPDKDVVRVRIQEALSVEARLSSGIERLRAFDLSADGEADAAFSAAEEALGNVSDRGGEALDLLNADPVSWDDVRAKLQAMQTAADEAATQVATGLAAVNLEAERNFPPTGVTGRCNQNAVQLRVAGSDSVSDDFWWTVGTPGAPARLANPEEPTSAGSLRARPTQIYSMQVGVPDATHSTVVEALALDDRCVPVPGVDVNFTTPPGSIVTVQSPQITTDANGVAEVTVSATDALGNGTATVNATVDSATASVGLTIVGPPSMLNLRLGGSEVQRIPNYGIESTVQVSAVLKDANGNDVANGTPVHFTISPPDHSFTDSGQVTTAGGQANATLVFGSATGMYTIEAESGNVSDAQPIRVVGNPAEVDVVAEPSIVSVNTPNPDKRSTQLTVTVRDSQGQWAPDGTIVEFEFVNPDDENWAHFRLTPDSLGRFITPITEGTASIKLEGHRTNTETGQPLGYQEVTVQVTATYSVSGEVRASVSDEITVILRGQTTFLPLIGR